MSPTGVLAVLSITIVLVVMAAAELWRSGGGREEARARLGAPERHLRRFARSDALLVRLPVLRTLGRRAADARIPLGTTDLVLLALALGYGLARVGEIVIGPTAGRPLGAVAAALFVWFGVEALHQRRSRQIESQLPDLVRLLSGSARAGLSLTGALQHAAGQVPDPIASELRRVVAKIELGDSLSDALDEFAARLGVLELEVVIWAVSIQHRAGGDLIQLLDELGQGITVTSRALQEARAITEPVKMQAFVCLGLGLGALALMNNVSGGGVEQAFDHPVISIVLLVCLGLLLASFLIVRAVVTKVRP